MRGGGQPARKTAFLAGTGCVPIPNFDADKNWESAAKDRRGLPCTLTADSCMTVMTLYRSSSSCQLHPLVMKAAGWAQAISPSSSEYIAHTFLGTANTSFPPSLSFEAKGKSTVQECQRIAIFTVTKTLPLTTKKLFYVPKLLTACKNFNL